MAFQKVAKGCVTLGHSLAARSSIKTVSRPFASLNNISVERQEGQNGFKGIFLPVQVNGLIDINSIREWTITPDTSLAVNKDIGIGAIHQGNKIFLRAGVSRGVIGILDPTTRVPLNVPIGQPGLDKEYKIPGAISRRVFEEPVSSYWIPAIEEAPTPNSSTEKQAARLIVIRRTKMNKHKLRKLRKKMKFRWDRVKERRKTRREKAYLDSKMQLIQEARKFDAKEYVASVIRKAKEEPIPRKWTDPLMPEWYKEQEMAKEIKDKRYQKLINLYLNKSIKIKTDRE